MVETRAEKVRWLLANVLDPDTGERLTIPRVAAKMRALGYDLSDNTLRNVCTGEVERPSFEVLEGIAKVFGVSPAFFSTDASIQDLEKQLAALEILKDAHVWNLAQRAVGVSPEGVDVAIAVLEHYRAKQGLDADPGGDDFSDQRSRERQYQLQHAASGHPVSTHRTEEKRKAARRPRTA